jgi:hypothetical protein
VLNSQSTAGATTYEANELAPVPTTPLPLFVDLRAMQASVQPIDNQGLAGAQVEAHLFARDLDGSLNPALRGAQAAQSGSVWDAITNPSANPPAVVMPFPPTPSWDTGSRHEVLLLPIHFWPNTIPGAPASDPEPPGRGSVKSARIYVPGVCSTELAFTTNNNDGLFDRVADELFKNFRDNVNKKKKVLIANGFANVYTRVTTLLDRGLAFGGTPRGGFFLYFWLQAGLFHPVVLQEVSVHFAANYEYELVLDDGRLAVVPTRNDLIVAPQSEFTDFRDALELQLPQKLHEAAAEQQHADVLKPCINGSPSVSAAFTAGQARNGALLLGLPEADADRVKTAVENPSNWECDGSNRALFITRAKRVNIYPDRVELVWFDREDPDDPMFGLYCFLVYAKSQNPSGPDPTKRLCSRSPRFVFPGTILNDPFVTVSRGPFVTQ